MAFGFLCKSNVHVKCLLCHGTHSLKISFEHRVIYKENYLWKLILLKTLEKPNGTQILFKMYRLQVFHKNFKRLREIIMKSL